MQRPLDVVGELSLLSGSGVELSVRADGRIIELGIKTVAQGYALASQISDHRQRTQILEQAQDVLKMADLIIHFRVAKRTVALLSGNSRPTVLSRLSGVAPVEIRPLALLLAMLRL